jgi:ribonuclease R
MVSFEVGPKGRISRPEIKEAIIKSHARLTYNQVQDFYDNDVIEKIPVEVQRSLLLLRQAAVVVRQARTRRGAIDFDVVESVIALDDQGEPLAINPQARLESHKIIEDLMVATNEIVATYFFKKNIPTVYRVHEPPSEEKLENFFTTAKAFGAIKAQAKKTAKDIIQPKDLQQIMAHYQKSQYKETLNQLMLRAMMQARYSEQNLMHFGLASPAYLHFTSPIRRYADLIVHRQLRYVLFEKKPRKQIPEDALAKIADSISQREALATDIERKIDRLYATTFMASRVGDSFDGTIVACTEFGFFVRIAEYHVEGLVHIANIASARVNFMPEKLSLVVSGSNQRYMVGDKVRVKLINVNIDRGHIDFELVRDAQEIKDDTEISDKRRRNTSSRLRSASRGRSKQRR